MSLTLVINDVRSAQNVGSLFRSADAFGVERIVLTGISPYPESQNDTRLPHVRQKATKMISKAALGAEVSVPFVYIKKIDMAIAKLKNESYQVIGLEQYKGSTALEQIKHKQKVALIVGNEVEGLSPTTIDQCDLIAEITMQGSKESLNVAVAGGIALYQLSSR